MPILIRLLTCALLISISFTALPAFAQDEDVDLETEDGGDFDDLEEELDQVEQSDGSDAAESAQSAPQSAPADDELDLDEDEFEPEQKAQKEETPPPAVEEEKKQAEKVPPTVEPADDEFMEAPITNEQPSEQFAEPTPAPEETPVAQEPPQESMPDTPDAEFEARMARIYKEFYANRTSDAEWIQIVGPKGSEKYTVQNGDTLWAISQTFFGNGFFWPKLWQLNSDFTNPHILEVSDTIQFSAGSVATEPTINLTQSTNKFNEPEVPKASVTPEQAKAYMANVQMPPPLYNRPVAKIPKSLPSMRHATSKYDDSGFSLSDVKRFTIPDTTHLNYSVTDTVPDRIGEVIETETGASQIALYQEGVLELDSGKTGERVYAFKVGDRIKNEYGSAYPIEYQGEFEILEDLGDGKYRALCTQTISPINVGSFIRKGSLPEVNFAKSGPAGKTKVAVFGGNYDVDRTNLGTGNIIYIDGGKSEGIEQGQLLSILKNHNLRNPSTNLKEPKEPIGLIKVINVSNSVATGVILESSEDIRPGDVTGPGDVY